jgi:hypothetical protein
MISPERQIKSRVGGKGVPNIEVRVAPVFLAVGQITVILGEFWPSLPGCWEPSSIECE